VLQAGSLAITIRAFYREGGGLRCIFSWPHLKHRGGT
jgi:hypothetical protein